MAVSSRTARRTVRRTTTRPVWVALAAVTALVALGPPVPTLLLYLPFALSLLVLGLPHGAVDHLTLLRARGATAEGGLWHLLHGETRDALAAVGVLYFVLGGVYLVGWLLAPAASFCLFVALTWFHWGQGDLYVLVSLVEETHLRTRAQRALALSVRGGLPMVVPLVAAPEQYRRVAASAVATVDPGAAAALDPLFTPTTRLVAGTGLLALSVVALAVGSRRAPRTRPAWRLDALETGLLWAYFLLVPPILAVGLYFCLWHSLRHVVRLELLDARARDALAASRSLPAFGRFSRDAVPLTAVALCLFVALAAFRPTGSASTLLGVYLVFLSLLTLPHVVVVTLLDRTQGVWRPGSA
ncbi:Brp/Blh family beta-carotene 15,15'-dioxygenase [Halomarina ordinaria]|uniref:Probable beta-carotene 15,15'-dioxygenase n=1 Tax=Halomarina ordinaria TaxID=3033939 RepID=A0ABD5UBX5_9EURY|nr:Brp/Blh family beta-carotene 15,15'-dioxygenase [Halomarina sp. PSRA2]